MTSLSYPGVWSAEGGRGMDSSCKYPPREGRLRFGNSRGDEEVEALCVGELTAATIIERLGVLAEAESSPKGAVEERLEKDGGGGGYQTVEIF